MVPGETRIKITKYLDIGAIVYTLLWICRLEGLAESRSQHPRFPFRPLGRGWGFVELCLFDTALGLGLEVQTMAVGRI